jgi:hypothetical protein
LPTPASNRRRRRLRRDPPDTAEPAAVPAPHVRKVRMREQPPLLPPLRTTGLFLRRGRRLNLSSQPGGLGKRRSRRESRKQNIPCREQTPEGCMLSPPGSRL